MISRGPQLGELRQRLPRVLAHPHGKQLVLQDLKEPTTLPRRHGRYQQHFWDATPTLTALPLRTSTSSLVSVSVGKPLLAPEDAEPTAGRSWPRPLRSPSSITVASTMQVSGAWWAEPSCSPIPGRLLRLCERQPAAPLISRALRTTSRRLTWCGPCVCSPREARVSTRKASRRPSNRPRF
jgi:hypothetical protein